MESDEQEPIRGMARHVAVVVHSLGAGGAQQRLVWLCNHFIALGRSVDLVVFDPDGPMRAQLDPAIRLIPIEASKIWIKSVRRRALGSAMTRYLRAHAPDVVMSGNNAVHMPVITAVGAAEAHTPLVLRVSNRPPSTGSRQSWLRRLRKWFSGSDARLYGRADAVIAVSQDTANHLRRIPGLETRHIDVIYNPTASSTLLDMPRERGRAGPCPLIIGAGRFVPQKDFETLIRAFSRVRARRPARLALLGDGPDRARLLRLVSQLGLQGDVELPGWVKDVPDWLGRADLLVSSSRYEGLQGTLIEALALGCPVVATDSPGGNREILDHGRLGPLVPVGDVLAMAEAMIATLDSPPDEKLLRAGAGRFSEDGKAEAYLEILDRACAHRSPKT